VTTKGEPRAAEDPGFSTRAAVGVVGGSASGTTESTVVSEETFLEKLCRKRNVGVDARSGLSLSRLETRLRCPMCGSREVTLIFSVPTNVQSAQATRSAT
jgi:hypothetical protein